LIFRNAIIFLTRRCPLGCNSCNVGATASPGADLSLDQLDRFFARQSRYSLTEHLIWTGGEPFESVERLEYGIKAAARLGLQSEVLTSGSWYRVNPGYLEWMKGMGDFSLRISLDGEHQSRVPLGEIFDLIGAGLGLGLAINFTLRDIPGQDFDIWKVKSMILQKFPGLKDSSRRFHVIPHFYTRRQGKGPVQVVGQRWRRPCDQIGRDLIIGNDGRVYPCCGIFQHPEYRRLSLGAIEDLQLTELLELLRKRPDLDRLQSLGPAAELERLGLRVDELDWPVIQNPCDICFALWNRRSPGDICTAGPD